MERPRFTYYLTTRGLSPRGDIHSLEYMPPQFHPFVTVVSIAANKKAILKKYPKVKYWANPVEINTASSKRRWIFENSEADDFFFINDETRIMTSIGGGKARVARDAPRHFFAHVRRMEELAQFYVGVAANQKPFSNGLLKSHAMTRENYVLGTWFHWNRAFVLKHIELDRFNYLDDVDYVLQALYKGYRVCNYAGILYEHRTTVPQRQHNDRTVTVQERDTKRLLKTHPTCIFRKPGYDPETQDIGVNVKFGPAYKPRRSVLIVYTKKSQKAALATYLMLMKRKLNFQIRCVSLDPVDGPETGLADATTLAQLRTMGYPSPGINAVEATVRMVNSSDVVLVLRSQDGEQLVQQFPRSPDRRLDLAKYGPRSKTQDLKFWQAAIRNWTDTGSDRK